MQITKVSVSDSNQSDEHLLRDYVRGQDPAAFAAIVRRHGPTVWTVCRRVLQRQHDAEDAFQATFLVLVLKARSVKNPQLLGSWLYGVAYRTSVKVRLAASRQSQREKPMVAEPVSDGETEAIWRDLRPVLDDELHRLPNKYRTPVLLCYLEGKSVEQAARALDLPRGTVLTRLAWARQRLRGRLTRRGLTLSSAILAALLLKSAAAERAGAAAELEDGPLVARLEYAADPSATATHLAQQVLQDMRARSLRSAAAVLLASMLAVWGGLVFTGRALSPSSIPQYTSTDEIYKLQGTWNVTAMERVAGRLAENNSSFTKVYVRGDTVLGCDQAGAEVVLFRLDPTNNPKSADFRRGALEALGDQVIYRLEGDTLKVAGRAMPRTFVSGKLSRDPHDYPILVITAKCEKPAFSSN